MESDATITFKCILLSVITCVAVCNNSSDYVKLHAPTDVTVAYAGTTDVFLFWYAPSNYEVHCVQEISAWEVERIHKDLNGSFADDGKYINRTRDIDLTRVDGGAYSLYDFSKLEWNLTNGGPFPTSNLSSTISANNTDKENQTTPSTETETNRSTESMPSSSSESIVTVAPINSNSSEGITSSPMLHSTLGPMKCSNKHSKVHYEFHTNDTKVSLKSQARILHYNVTYRPIGQNKSISQKVSATRTDFLLKELQSNHTYRVSVSVKYASGDVLVSSEISFKTVPKNCLCDKIGSIQSSLKCDVTSLFYRHVRRPCHCKAGHAGMFCQHCAFGYYRLDPHSDCFRCPCKPYHSNTGCHFEEGYLFCDVCALGYTGNQCQECDLGYYRDRISGRCRRCQCHSNSLFCNALTGECRDCLHNTAGFSCERCQHDYVGDAKKQTCVHKSELKVVKHLPKGVIAVIVVLIILLICGIVGLIAYRKYRHLPVARPFWTVELKDDHEGVNFSTVPDDDRLVVNEDSNFYEKQGGRRNWDGSQIYSPLKETT